MIHHVFRAMGTTVDAFVADEQAAHRLESWFAGTEARLSRFIETSELERLNADPAASVRVSPFMANVLREADRIRVSTDGLVDVAVGGAVRSWGYDRTFSDVADLPAAPPPPPRPRDWRLVRHTLHRTPGERLDLGGVAKGWAADRVVSRGEASMVSVGGDVRSAHPDTRIDIMDPAGDHVVRVVLGPRALATSSTAHRSWRVGDAAAHHLIDPRTGAPARSPIVQATVVADNAVDAEAGAKAVILHGAAGLAWADRQPWIHGALSIWRDGAVYATTGLETAA